MAYRMRVQASADSMMRSHRRVVVRRNGLEEGRAGHRAANCAKLGCLLVSSNWSNRRSISEALRSRSSSSVQTWRKSSFDSTLAGVFRSPSFHKSLEYDCDMRSNAFRSSAGFVCLARLKASEPHETSRDSGATVIAGKRGANCGDFGVVAAVIDGEPGEVFGAPKDTAGGVIGSGFAATCNPGESGVGLACGSSSSSDSGSGSGSGSDFDGSNSFRALPGAIVERFLFFGVYDM